MATRSKFRHEDVSAVPRGWKVRTVRHPSGHQVRIAFPAGPQRTGSGRLVSLLHPETETNPCPKNPLEEMVKDSKGKQWWVTVIGSGEKWMAEGYPVSGGKIKTVGRPIVAHGITEAAANDALIEKMEKNPKKGVRSQESGVRSRKKNPKRKAAKRKRKSGSRESRVGSWKKNPKRRKNRGETKIAHFSKKFHQLEYWTDRQTTTFVSADTVDRARRIIKASGVPQRLEVRKNPARRKNLDDMKNLASALAHRWGLRAGYVEKYLRYKYSSYKDALWATAKMKQEPDDFWKFPGGANPKSKIQNPKSRKNLDEIQEAQKLYESFQGKASTGVIDIHEPDTARDDFAMLGWLISLTVQPRTYEKEIELRFGNDKVRLASNAEGSQLYCIGGSQNLNGCLAKFKTDETKDLVELGEAVKVVYLARKAHTNFEPTEWEHTFGEEGGEMPFLHYNRLQKRIFFVGGHYTVESPGIID